MLTVHMIPVILIIFTNQSVETLPCYHGSMHIEFPDLASKWILLYLTDSVVKNAKSGNVPSDPAVIWIGKQTRLGRRASK